MLKYRQQTLGRPLRITHGLREEYEDFPVGELKGYFVKGHQAQVGETVDGTEVVPFEVPNPSIQITGSEPHKRGPKGKFLEGGPFYTAKKHLNPFSVGRTGRCIFHSGSLTRYNFVGASICVPRSLWYNEFLAASLEPENDSVLDAAGATAISRCSPVNPSSELGTGLSETYREGLPGLPGIHTWRDRADVVRKAGSEFLNIVFGWKPLTDEVRDVARTVANSQALMLRFERQANEPIRRTYQFPINRSETESVVATNTKAEVGTGWSGVGKNASAKGKVTRHEVNTRRLWFSGAFLYPLPSHTDTWRASIANGTNAKHLLGISLTPELLWNLTPWSWAVDWFSNTGDVLNNIGNFIGAGQIMKYGYIMEEYSKVVTYTMDRSSVFVGEEEIPVPDVSYEIITKVRRPADPYGFGVHLSDLSPLQIAIATAVGISLL